MQHGSIGDARQTQSYAKLVFQNILIFQDFFSFDFRLLLFSKSKDSSGTISTEEAAISSIFFSYRVEA